MHQTCERSPFGRRILRFVKCGLLAALLCTGKDSAPLQGEDTGGKPAPQLSDKTTGVAGSVTYVGDAKRPWPYGRYYIQERKTGRLAEAVVCLSGPNLIPAAKADSAIQAKPATRVIDQKDYRFDPETIAIQAGDQVQFTNSDAQVHNVNAVGGLHPFDQSIKPGGEFNEQFKKAGGIRRPVVLGCKFHSVMRGWVYVFDHPFFAVTDTDGRFRFSGVPPGEYTLQMAHPAGGLQWSQKVLVKEHQTTEVEIRIGPDQKLATDS